MEESRISDILDRERFVNVKIISQPQGSEEPVHPKRLMMMGLGFGFAVIFCLVLLFASDFFDHTIKHDGDLKKYLGLPVLVSIQEVKKRKSKNKRNKQWPITD